MNGPIFILSDFRAGSTMLRFILDAHPDICCPAELGLAQVCQSVFRVAELTTDDRSRDADELFEMRVGIVRKVVDDLMCGYCARRSKARWCEKSPSNTSHLGLLRAVFPDAYFVCLYRQALDQIYSFLELDEIEKRLQVYWLRHHGNLLAAAADRWCTQTESLLAFEGQGGVKVRRVYYERVVAATEEELASLLSFLEAPWVPDLSVAAFQTDHERGPADKKVERTVAVDSKRTGKGCRLDLTTIPNEIWHRVLSIQGRLGYGRIGVDGDWTGYGDGCQGASLLPRAEACTSVVT